MNSTRKEKIKLGIASSVLLSVLMLAACGGQPSTPTAATSTRQVATSAAPQSPAVTSAATRPAVFGNEIRASQLGPTGDFSTSGNYVSDYGFRSAVSGFSFENYGAGNYTNLTPVEMRRIFGDQVCASLEGGNCILHPQVEQVMDMWNKSMDGGHCYGFSVAALRFYKKQLNPGDFGAVSIADLKVDGNEKLQREIAYAFIFQYLPPVRGSQIAGTPNEILDRLIQLLKPGASAPDSYTIGFFKAEGGGGHAVTPLAVEDLGNGIFAVLIYDNNFPKSTKAILFDRNANKWSYTASINPSVPTELYWGDANTKSLFLFPTNPGTEPQQFAYCEFCGNSDPSRVPGLAAPFMSKQNAIFLEGNPQSHAHLLISDDQGRRYGYTSDGKFVKEIPGVDSQKPFINPPSTWSEDEEPIYYVPSNLKVTLTIDGSSLKAADVTSLVMVGPGYDIGIENIKVDPGQKDTLTLSPDGTQLSYKTASSESPDIIVGVQAKPADYSFLIKGFKMDGGGTIAVGLNMAKGQLSLNVKDTKGAGTYGLLVERIDTKGVQVFGHDNITLASGATAYLNFLKWPGGKATMALDIDSTSSGTIDQTIQLTEDK